MPLLRPSVEAKTPDQVEAMRRAGLVVGETLELLRGSVRVGMTTADVDALAEEFIRDQGAVPAFLGYQGFPGTLCISVDDEIVHGIPGDRVLGDGAVVSLDCGAVVDGWYGDAAITVVLGEPTSEVAELLDATEEAMWRGVAAVRPGNRIGDVSHAVESSVRAAGADLGLVAEYTGHGIGRALHMSPDVPNLGRPGRGPRIPENAVLAVEPMVTLGSPVNDLLDDDWTVVTRSGRSAAHFEHTVAATPEGPWVLTAVDGGRARLGALGVPCGAR